MLDIYDDSFRNMAEGEVVKGTVLKVTDTEVVVDVGYKSEGVIPVDEFLDETGQVTVQAGDVVDVLLERTEDREGHIVLSREKAEKMKIWDEVETRLCRTQSRHRPRRRTDQGRPRGRHRRARLPARQSQIDVRPVRNLDALKGQELRMRVIKVNKKRGNIVLSRKVLLEEENAEKKKSTLETLAEGKVLRGIVKNITDYGAFIDLGGIDGLLHITDMSWGRVDHPSELFKVDDEIDVVVLKYDPATERVSLGHKQLMQDPWTTVHGSLSRSGARVQRQGRQPHRLRRVRRARGGRRRPDPRQRDVVEQARQAPVEDPQRRRHGRRAWCSASTRRRAASRSASSRSRATRGTSWPRSIRSARASRARSATSPSSARSSRSKKTSTA